MPLTPEANAARLLVRARALLANPKALQAVRSGVNAKTDVKERAAHLQSILDDISDPVVRDQMRAALADPATVKTDG